MLIIGGGGASTPTAIRNKVYGMEKQTNLLSAFYRKLSKKTNVKIVCQGDSLTYGQDTISADKVAATGTADNGEAHGLTTALNTYPAKLQEFLRLVYGNTSTVINKGYSGDWVANGIAHWTNNESADLAILMYGTNDSNYGASWVPVETRGNLDQFINNYRTLITNYLAWNTPVIIFTPPRTRDIEDIYTTTANNIEPFRNALFLLGKEYNIPVIDVESFFNGCDNTYYSDSIHLNSKGYTYLAARAMGIFVGGCNPFSIPRIRSGDTILVRATRDNIVYNCAITTSTGSLGTEETNDGGSGILAVINGNSSQSISFGFETLEDNLILIPVQGISVNARSEITLDFNQEQGSIPLLSAANQLGPQGTKPVAQLSTTTATSTANTYDGTVNISTTSLYLHITNKGYHSIRVQNIGTANAVYLNGFIVMSYKDFITQYKIRAL